ncbi:MAG: transporter substrate-binding domain-containing protein [Spirochaetes bacterium]|nr:transporter substrate-binding domain-containing protein [Spirochaetota bacterium]
MSRQIFVFLLYLLFILQLASQIKIITVEEPPTNYQVDGKLLGTTVDIVKEMIKLSGEQHHIEVLPGNRALQIVNSEPNIMLFTLGKTQQRIDLGYHFIGPVITRKHALLSTSNSKIKIKNIQSLNKYSIGGLSADWRVKYFTDQGITVDLNTNNESNFKKLFLERIDLVISSDIEALSLTKLVGKTPADVKIVWVIKEAPSYIIFSKHTPFEIVKKWETLFRKVMDSKIMDKYKTKWNNILGVAVKFDQQKGFIIQ